MDHGGGLAVAPTSDPAPPALVFCVEVLGSQQVSDVEVKFPTGVEREVGLRIALEAQRVSQVIALVEAQDDNVGTVA